MRLMEFDRPGECSLRTTVIGSDDRQVTWLWWWILLRLSKRQSPLPITVLLRTTLTWTIKLHYYIITIVIISITIRIQLLILHTYIHTHTHTHTYFISISQGAFSILNSKEHYNKKMDKIIKSGKLKWFFGMYVFNFSLNDVKSNCLKS